MQSAHRVICCGAIDIFDSPVRQVNAPATPTLAPSTAVGRRLLTAPESLQEPVFRGEMSAILRRFATVSGKLRYGR